MHQRSGAPLPKQGARGALIAGTAAGTCRLPVSALAAPPARRGRGRPATPGSAAAVRIKTGAGTHPPHRRNKCSKENTPTVGAGSPWAAC